jgi:hypothetical protein
MKQRSAKSLEQELLDLPRDIVPPRNLWPGISQRLAAPRRSRPVLMAACVAAAAACIASLFTWAVLRRAEAPQGLSVVAQGNPYNATLDAKYIKAHDELQRTFEQRLSLLDPKTRTQIEASLETIRQAKENIRRALQADPSSPLLEELWQSTWHDEIDLYDRVVQTTEPTETRS